MVRSVQRCVQMEAATLARQEYYVAVEFVEPTSETTAVVQRIIQNSLFWISRVSRGPLTPTGARHPSLLDPPQDA